MKRRFSLTLAATTLMIGSHASAVIVSSTPTDLGSGLTQYTFALSTESGDPGLIGGMDLTFTAQNMNQINPVGSSTVFQDNNAFFPLVGESVDEDSQFLFDSSDLLLAPGVAAESGSLLTAAFALPDGSAELPFAQRDIAQIVVPTGSAVAWSGRVTFANTGGQGQDVSGVIPEPSSLALLGLGSLLVARRRK